MSEQAEKRQAQVSLTQMKLRKCLRPVYRFLVKIQTVLRSVLHFTVAVYYVVAARARSLAITWTGLYERADSILRFDVHQRIQHFLMMSSFIVLALTGLPQKFFELNASQSFIAFLGGLESVQFIHRFSAWVMMVSCGYHLLYLITTLAIKKNLGPLRMLPGLKDILDVRQTVLYWLGFVNEGPKFGRYTYLEKFDYWAVFWGIFIMGGSGLILIFPVIATRILPGGFVPVAHAAHSDEAILAIGWIAIVHILRAHFWPGIFPFNTAIFTGWVSHKRYEEEHPLEYEEIMKRKESEKQLEVPIHPVTERYFQE